MKDRTLENKTRMTIDGQRYRVGNPNHPHHELYKESGIDAVYDTMFKAPAESTESTYENEYGLTIFAVLVSLSLGIGALLALGGVL